MAILRLFGVFCYISFFNFERVFMSSEMTEKPKIWHIFSFYHYLLTAKRLFENLANQAAIDRIKSKY